VAPPFRQVLTHLRIDDTNHSLQITFTITTIITINTTTNVPTLSIIDPLRRKEVLVRTYVE